MKNSFKIWLIFAATIVTSCYSEINIVSHKTKANPNFYVETTLEENLNFKLSKPILAKEFKPKIKNHITITKVISPKNFSNGLNNKLADDKNFELFLKALTNNDISFDTINQSIKNMKELFFNPNDWDISYSFPFYYKKINELDHLRTHNKFLSNRDTRHLPLSERLNIDKNGLVLVPILNIRDSATFNGRKTNVEKKFILTIYLYEDFELKYCKSVILNKKIEFKNHVNDAFRWIHLRHIELIKIKPFEFDLMVENVFNNLQI